MHNVSLQIFISGVIYLLREALCHRFHIQISGKLSDNLNGHDFEVRQPGQPLLSLLSLYHDTLRQIRSAICIRRSSSAGRHLPQRLPVLSAYPSITSIWLSQLILPINPHKLRLKDERRPCRNRPHSSIPIAEFRRYRELPLLADAHVKQAFVPANT